MARAFADLTTLRVGGSIRTVIEPKSETELVDAVRRVWASGDEWVVLGGGSNTVASDREFEGTVIHVVTRGIDRIPVDDGAKPPNERGGPGTVRLKVQAGESWDYLVNYTVRRGWAGLEGLSGIPGSTGAAPVQNLNAYDYELAASLVAIDFLDFATGAVRRVSASELQLGYRMSALKRGVRGVVIAIEIDLDSFGRRARGISRPVSHPQLTEFLGIGAGDRAPVKDIRRGVLALRSAKGMVLDDADPDSVSVGSFFINPTVTASHARTLPDAAPRWPVASIDSGRQTISRIDGNGAVSSDVDNSDDRSVRFSAAWFIEHSGVHRGFSLPGSRAAISKKHALALVNTGGATAAEIVELADFARARVAAEFGVVLETEPFFVDRVRSEVLELAP